MNYGVNNQQDRNSVNLVPDNSDQKKASSKSKRMSINPQKIINPIQQPEAGLSGVKVLAEGAVKRVSMKPGDDKHVFYTPKKDSKLKELFAEVKALEDIGARLEEKGKNLKASSIAPAPRRLPESEWIDGKPTLEAEKQAGDLDQALRGELHKDGKAIRFDTSGILNIIKNIFNGVSSLHIADRIHDDLKPDNFLLLSQPEENDKKIGVPGVELNDLGKVQNVRENEVKMHKGNTRTGLAPEGIASKQSEVWSCGILAIYSLEQKFITDDRMNYIVEPSKQQVQFISSKIGEIESSNLPEAKKTQLIENYLGVIKKITEYSSEIEKGNFENYDKLKKILIMVQKTKSKSEKRADQKPKREYPGDMLIHTDINCYKARNSKRVGIEKFMVFNPDCPQGESSGLQNIKVRIRSIFKLAMAKLHLSSKPNPHARNPVHEYIDALFTKLETDDAMNQEQCEDLKKLLKEMTAIDPSKRPTMEDALKRYEKIFPKGEKENV